MDALFKGLNIDYLAKCDPAKSGKAWQVILPAGSIVAAAQRLLAADWHLEDVFVLDVAEGFLVTYHFAHFERPGRVALRVLAGHDAPSVPSIAGIFAGAEWHERETRDFHGVAFAGNPNPVPLLLDPDMADEAPLRKDPKSRMKMRELLEAGEALYVRPGFDLMTPDAPAAAEGAAGDKAASA